MLAAQFVSTTEARSAHLPQETWSYSKATRLSSQRRDHPVAAPHGHTCIKQETNFQNLTYCVTSRVTTLPERHSRTGTHSLLSLLASHNSIETSYCAINQPPRPWRSFKRQGSGRWECNVGTTVKRQEICKRRVGQHALVGSLVVS